MLKCKRLDGENAQALAERLGCPLCMLLRANGVYSGVWLEMSEEAAIPEGKCRADEGFPCPRDFVKAEIPEKIGYIVENGDTALSIAGKFGIPRRLVLAVCSNHLQAGMGILLPEKKSGMKMITVGPDTTWRDFDNAPSLMLLNHHFSVLYPGMKLLIRG